MIPGFDIVDVEREHAIEQERNGAGHCSLGKTSDRFDLFLAHAANLALLRFYDAQAPAMSVIELDEIDCR